MSAKPEKPGRDLTSEPGPIELTAEGELALLRELIRAASSGPGVEPLAAAAARMITASTATDVCFVHVLDDSERALTLAGATPPFDAEIGKIRLPLGQVELRRVGVARWFRAGNERTRRSRNGHGPIFCDGRPNTGMNARCFRRSTRNLRVPKTLQIFSKL